MWDNPNRFYFGDHVLTSELNSQSRSPRRGVEALPQAAAELLRGGDGGQTIVWIKDGNPAGQHVVIMDDLGESGATLVECKKLLFADEAIKVCAYVTHGVFPKKSWERFLHGEGDGEEGERERCLTYFWMTDSCPFTAEAVEGTAPLRCCLLLAPLEILSKSDQALCSVLMH